MYLTAGFLRRLAAGLLIILYLGAEARAADRQLRVNWTELAPNVTGRRILTVLTDGVMLEGRVAALKPEALVLEVKKTSDPIRFRGTADVPRELVSTLRVSRPGWKWRVIGPLMGFIGGGLAGGAIGGRVNPGGGFIISDGAATGITYGALGGAGLGYFAGHFGDRHTTIIQITR